MTIDQISVTARSPEPIQDLAALTSQAREQAKQIVAKARYEAFRMVTDARAEAEAILDEQTLIAPPDLGTNEADSPDPTPAADTGAEDIAEVARLEAVSLVAQWTAELADANASLVSEHDALESRLLQTRSLVERLEGRLARIAAAPSPTAPTAAAPAALPPRAPGPSTNPQPVDAHVPAAKDPHKATPNDLSAVSDEQTASPPPAGPIDYSPSVPHPVAADPHKGAPVDEKGSYYSRRSAKLPRIGDSGGKDALTAMRSMRKGLNKGELNNASRSNG